MRGSNATEAGKAILCIAVCEAAGVVGAFFTRPAIGTWYAALDKPGFTPPNWLFGPVWIALYALMGVSAYLVWRRGIAGRAVKWALAVFAAQLVLNAAWSPAFFGLRSTLAGLAVIIPLWFVICATIVLFWRVTKPAGMLLVPYIVWVTYATALNASLWQLNR